MTRFNVHGLGFTLFLAVLTALPALSIDMVLPGLSMIQAEFHAPQTEAASAIAALAWNTAAYTSEIIRAGLDAVPQGQQEATSALGMSRGDALRFVIIPQGLRVAIPALLGFSILVFQGTSLCFTIALQEIISRASN